MEKAEFKIPFTAERLKKMAEDSHQLSEKLKADPQIRALIERGDIDESCVDAYPWKLSAWRKSVEPCLGCKSLSACRQKTTGYCPAVRYDGVLQTVQKACRYMQVKEEKEAHMDNYVVNDLPEKLRTVSLEDIPLQNESAEYVAAFTSIVQCSEERQSLYLYGNMGTGKTFLAAGACNDHARMKESTAFIHYPTFCSRMAGFVMNNAYKQELNRLMYVKFLVIDDLGAESCTEWNRDSLLLPLLNARSADGLPTWITSNCDLDKLKVHYAFSSKGTEDELKADRIMERIETMCRIQPLTGKDRRK